MTKHVHYAKRFVSIRRAAKELGVSYRALLRAVNSGVVPSYRPFNSRRFVTIEEVRQAIRASKVETPSWQEPNCDDPVENLAPPDLVIQAWQQRKGGKK